MFPCLRLTILALFTLLAGEAPCAGPQSPLPEAPPVQDSGDPEATPEGRKEFLGRRVARTMHSSGANWLLRERREQEEGAMALRRWLDLQPGQVVCDFGCGNGYHTLPMARAVGAEGQVYAVDLQQEMLRLLGVRLAEADIQNTLSIESTLDDPRLPENTMDMILMVDVYHELSHPVRVMGGLRRALKPKGRMVLIEYRREDPEVRIKALHRMDRVQVVREMAEHGLRLTASFEELPWQHALVFERVPDPGPRHQAREVALGFLRALERGDRMGIAPFLTSIVTMEGGIRIPRKDFVGGTGLRFGKQDGGVVQPLELRAGEGRTLLAGPLPRPPAFSLFSVWGDSEVPGPGALGELILRMDGNGAWMVEGWQALVPDLAAGPPSRLTRPFFAMNTGTGQGKGTPQEQAEMVGQLGFDGIGWGIWRAREVRRKCEEQGGDLWSIYCALRLDEGDSPKYQQLLKAMHELEGGPGMIWLAIQKSKDEIAQADQMGAAEKLLRPLLDLAQRTGVEVALYPHQGFWISRTVDALAVCEELDHPRLGTCFNLCHFLATHETSDPASLLQTALPYLRSVTICGADRNGEGWESLIQRLGDGDYPLGDLLDTLDALPWAGPVGLQAWGIKAAPREHLAASFGAWRAAQVK